MVYENVITQFASIHTTYNRLSDGRYLRGQTGKEEEYIESEEQATGEL